MKILLIGNGGRENAIAWKISNSDSFFKSGGKLFCTKGNPGIEKYAESIDIDQTDISSLIKFAEAEKIDFTIVGPEIPLSMGIVDEFEKKGFKIFGPTKKAAEIETSKIFAKKLMLDNNIPTANYKAFSKVDFSDAVKFIDECKYPLVFKADGLAAGKGVLIANDKNESLEIIKDFSEGSSFKEAGMNFIIEEFLEGEEISVFAICDGEEFVLLPFAQDHKRVSEGDTGKNTGGMGAVAPIGKYMTEEMVWKIRENIVKPVLGAMKDIGAEFRGCLFCGLMIVNNEPFVIEFNCRFGDPETQAVLPLIESDFLHLLISSADKSLKNFDLKINNKNACCVVLASNGYPDKYETGKEIIGIENVSRDSFVFQSGTKFGKDKTEILSNGGRVISVVGISEKSLEDAVRLTYENTELIKFENKYFRKDIGFRQISNSKESVN